MRNRTDNAAPARNRGAVELSAAERLDRLPLTPSHEGKGDTENHDSDDSDDVRHHGDQTGNVAGVGPDEADDRSHDEHGDHRSQPVQNPSSGDEPSLLSWGALGAGQIRRLSGGRDLSAVSPVMRWGHVAAVRGVR